MKRVSRRTLGRREVVFSAPTDAQQELSAWECRRSGALRWWCLRNRRTRVPLRGCAAPPHPLTPVPSGRSLRADGPRPALGRVRSATASTLTSGEWPVLWLCTTKFCHFSCPFLVQKTWPTPCQFFVPSPRQQKTCILWLVDHFLIKKLASFLEATMGCQRLRGG